MNKVIFLIFLVIADQLSKYFIVKNLSIGESFNIFSFLDLYLILNTGIAFSFFDDGGVYGRWILVTLVLLVCVYLTYILFTEKLRVQN